LEAGDVLASSLDFDATLRSVAELSISVLADWCAIDLVQEDGALHRLTVVHQDPAKVELANSLQERYPPNEDSALHTVIRTGEPFYLPDIPPEMLDNPEMDESLRDTLKGLGLRSAMVVPLLARGRTLGAVSFVTAESQRRLEPSDLALAEEFARRCAIALDNARLYRESEQQRAALEESERQLRITLQASRVGTWRWDVLTDAVQWSQTLEEVHGMAPGTFGGTLDAYKRDIHPEDRERVLANIAETMREGALYSTEYRIIRPDGQVRWLMARGEVLRNRMGRPMGLIGVCMDVTERREADEVRSRLAAIVESSTDAIVSETLDGIITSWNTGAEKMFGYTEKEAVGRPLSMLTPPDRMGEVTDALQRLRRGETVEAFQTVRLRKDGTPLFVSIGLSPLRDAFGKTVGASVIARDVTAARRAEEQIAASLQEKEVLLKELQHRVKNNMQVISSLLSLQSAHIEDERAVRALRESESRVRAMMLAHERLYASQVLGRIDFSRYVHELVGELMRSYLGDSKDVKVAIAVDQMGLDLDSASHSGLILNELVTNALKHAFPGGAQGEIRVEAVMLDDGRIRLRVSDDGVGMPSDVHYRTSPTLGLQLVNSLALQMGGALEVKTGAGEGTSVTLTFKP
jgi:PAS domain S-box-containing protein